MQCRAGALARARVRCVTLLALIWKRHTSNGFAGEIRVVARSHKRKELCERDMEGQVRQREEGGEREGGGKERGMVPFVKCRRGL